MQLLCNASGCNCTLLTQQGIWCHVHCYLTSTFHCGRGVTWSAHEHLATFVHIRTCLFQGSCMHMAKLPAWPPMHCFYA